MPEVNFPMKKAGFAAALILLVVLSVCMVNGILSEDVFVVLFFGIIIGGGLVYIIGRNRDRLAELLKKRLAKTGEAAPPPQANGCEAAAPPGAPLPGPADARPEPTKAGILWRAILGFILAAAALLWTGYLLYHILSESSIARFGGAFFFILSAPAILLMDIVSALLARYVWKAKRAPCAAVAVILLVLALIPILLMAVSLLLVLFSAALGR